MLAILSLILSNWRPLAYAGLAAAALAFGAYEYHHIYSEGESAAIQNVEKANDQERAKAQQGDDAVRACYAHGGDWDRTTGVCVGPAR
jgi:hypothetical protein